MSSNKKTRKVNLGLQLRNILFRIKFVKNITKISLKEVLGSVFLTFLSNFMTIGAMGLIIMFAKTLTDPSTPIPEIWIAIIYYLPEKARQGRGTILMIFACGIIGLKIFANLTSYFAKLKTSQIAEKVKIRSSKIIFEKILSKKLEFFDKQLVSEVNNILNKSSTTIPKFITLFQKSLLEILMLLTIIFFMVKISTILTIAAFLVVALGMFIATKSKIYVDKINRALKKEEKTFDANISELFANPELIKSNVTEAYEVSKFKNAVETTGKNQLKMAVRSELLPLIRDTSEMFSIFFIAGLIAFMRYFNPDSVEIGSSFAFLYLVRTLSVKAGGIVSSLTSFVNIFFYLEEIQDFFVNFDDEEENEEEKLPLHNLDHSISIKDLSFSYGSRELSRKDDNEINIELDYALQNIDLDITAGNTIAILGKSGSGKSTLAKLLLQMYDCKQGEITFNDTDISSYKKDMWRKRISFVPQHSFVLPGTILDNILYGSLERKVSPQELETAIDIANLQSLLSKSENGLDTNILSSTLSGGEKQRIAIARAVLRKADLYIFDEASSAIDPHTERSILKKLQSLLVNKTILFITHRSAAIEYANSCYFFENGKSKLVKDSTFVDHETLTPYLSS